MIGLWWATGGQIKGKLETLSRKVKRYETLSIDGKLFHMELIDGGPKRGK